MFYVKVFPQTIFYRDCDMKLCPSKGLVGLGLGLGSELCLGLG